MSDPTIDEARLLGRKHQKRGVIILSITAEGQYAFASYGATRQDCRAMALVVDQIAELIEAEQVEIPPRPGDLFP